MKTQLTFIVLLLIVFSCTKKEESSGDNENNATGSKSRCWETQSKYFDSTGELRSTTTKYYTDGFLDSSVIISVPGFRLTTKYTYISKYERKVENYINNQLDGGIWYLEKVNEHGMVIEARSVRNGQVNKGKVITLYNCY